MADFACPVVRVDDVQPIEGADFIVAANVADYKCVIQKGSFNSGDLAIYIPEGSIVPVDILEELGLTGKLAGPAKNRVKAIKLRKTLSQGLLYPYSKVLARIGESAGATTLCLCEGADCATVLGVTKYEPPIPAHFAGQIQRPRGDFNLLRYDIENIKAYKRVFQEGEPVVMTEKIHGTLMQAVYWPATDQFAVSSKGLGARGFIIENNEANAGNTYIRAAKKHDLESKLRKLCTKMQEFNGEGSAPIEAIFVVGEVYGNGIQDLGYATDLGFRVFDIYVGKPGQGHFLSYGPLQLWSRFAGLELVPEVYLGQFTREALETATNGVETVSGCGVNLREGVVVKPLFEREDPKLGRVILKSVSEAYLLRKAKDGKEVTEYQ